VTHSDRFSMQPAEVTEATRQLDELANRVEQVMRAEELKLAPVASARDEVSQRVAATLAEVHASFVRASDKGNLEIREAAAALRAHTGNVVAADQDFAV
jgi:hypothetical protein